MNMAEVTAKNAPTRAPAAAPMSSGASRQRALRTALSIISLRLIKVSSCTRRSSCCHDAFSSSSSMVYLRVGAQPFLETIDLGRDVGGGDAEDLRDLVVRPLFQVEQQQRAVERSLRVDEAAQNAAAVVRVECRADGRVVELRLERHGSPAPWRFAAQPGNRHVERDAVQPGRETARRIVGRICTPRLRGDFLRQVLDVGAPASVGVGHLEDETPVGLEQRGKLGAGGGIHGCGLLHGSAVMVRSAERDVTVRRYAARSGSPSSARMAAREASRSCSAGSASDDSAIGTIGAPYRTSIRPGRGKTRVAGMLRRVPRITAGTTGQAARAAIANAPVWNLPRPTSGVNVPSGKNTSECPLAAVRRTRRASAAPLWRLKRSTNSEPMRRRSSPARGTSFISRLITKPKRGGSAAVMTTPSR